MAPINRTATKVTVIQKKPVISSENDALPEKALYSKRKAEHSPPKNGTVKRPALNTINNIQLINNGKATKVKSIVKNEKSTVNRTSIAPGTETRAKLSRFHSGVRLQGPFVAGSNVTKSRPSNINQVSPVPNSLHDLKSKPSTRSTVTVNGVRSVLTSKPTVAKSAVCHDKKVPAKAVAKEISRKPPMVHEDKEQTVNASKNESVVAKLRPRASKCNEERVKLETVDETKNKFHKSPFPSRRSQRQFEKNDSMNGRLEETQELPTEKTKSYSDLIEECKQEESNITLRRSLRNISNTRHLTGEDDKLEKIEEQSTEEIKPCSELIEECKQDESGFTLRRSLRNVANTRNLSEENEKMEKIEEQLSDGTKSCSKCPEKNEQEGDKIKIRRSLRNVASSKKSDENEKCEEKKPTRRSSTRFSLTRKSLSADKSAENGSLYVSALEDITFASIKEQPKIEKDIFSELSEFDKELLHDPHQVSLYAMEIFEYLKTRESHFRISDYMYRQPYINKKMRATLVDWMVEVQENFELNHETLYLAVKLVDMYLEKVKIHKESLQLVGAAAIFLSCKYDERLSPLIDDFLYVGDGAYDQIGLLAMEQSILKHINFELSIPISYSFLRRYARCARIQMPLLTLARYILELGLMDYSTVTLSDSKQAAASLYLAFRMVNYSDWTDALVYYTGYKVSDFKDIVLLFNRILHQKPNKEEVTIRNKYSHELFFKVAETPLLRNEELKLDA